MVSHDYYNANMEISFSQQDGNPVTILQRNTTNKLNLEVGIKNKTNRDWLNDSVKMIKILGLFWPFMMQEFKNKNEIIRIVLEQ